MLLSDARLYTFIDTAYIGRRSPAEIAQQLIDGGSDLIQLRAKEKSPDEIRCMAESVLSVTERAHIPLAINDYPEIARDVGAPFCHLGQEDFFDAGHRSVTELRDRDNPLNFGLSTHAPDQCQRAVEAGADYVAIGPVYPTGTKPSAHPVTLDYVRWAASNVSIPWFAIGGINLHTIDAVLEAGASRVCIVSAILQAPDIARACQSYKSKLP